MRPSLPKIVFTFLLLMSIAVPTLCQDIGFQRGRYKNILFMIVSDIKDNYYDPTFRGIDIEAKRSEAEKKMNSATSIGQLNAIIAQVLIDFNDSHLFYSPPGRVNRVDYGFKMRMIGDKPFVVSVDKDSDAEKKGVKIGDEIYAFDGYAVSRENMWKLGYAYNALRPKAKIRLDLIKPDKTTLAIEVMAKITEGKAVTNWDFNEYSDYVIKQESRYRAEYRHLYSALDDVFIWKMPAFDMTPGQVEGILGRAKKHAAFIIDVRGNGGGRVDMLTTLIGGLFPNDIKVGDQKMRKTTKDLKAKGSGKDSYQGKVIVLIDSGSASSSEILPRVMQLEKRGVVLGDRSAGAVMESIHFPRKEGEEIMVFFATSITIADLIMKDGKSLEHVGVTPDELLLPTAQEMATGADPILARALALAGKNISAAEAGKILPIN